MTADVGSGSLVGAVTIALTPLFVGSVFFVGRTVSVRRTMAWALLAGGLASGVLGLYLVYFGPIVAGARDNLSTALAHAFLGAAVPEELLKITLLWCILSRAAARSPVTPLVAVLCGMLIGLGFASVENAFYAAMNGLQVDGIRLLTAMPCHAFLGAVAAYYLVYAERGGGALAVLKAFVVPVLGHGLYNLPLVVDVPPLPWQSSADDMVLTCLTLLWLATWARMLLARLRPLSAFSPE